MHSKSAIREKNIRNKKITLWKSKQLCLCNFTFQGFQKIVPNLWQPSWHEGISLHGAQISAERKFLQLITSYDSSSQWKSTHKIDPQNLKVPSCFKCSQDSQNDFFGMSYEQKNRPSEAVIEHHHQRQSALTTLANYSSLQEFKRDLSGRGLSQWIIVSTKIQYTA